ncbi:molybdopterin-dependent oxidoreductase [Alkalibacter saccharofermentans]|uniref:Oxidoreductase molybdopterin binding domain-containing protein n=1 Tax=Alkalibacter saccharofermentans DSM 14828 TaxID=1120975 RepID=A0A1M4UUR5_9FIRM|nr:molybdopterin-dependent oxidoreductase [Alkalibacter saccharofermentans]SHE60425.1 Oxidoreductase molybdopterin binding domain-containing protein [Alkalibacter saccharofermentans DSM 14828]
MQKVLCISIFLIAFTLLFLGCTESLGTDGQSSATVSRYRESEIREYQGANLDPAIGPNDNSIIGVQYVDIDEYNLEISGLVNNPIKLKYSEVLELDSYERLITLYCVVGWDATILWKGVLLEDIMNLAGIKPEANTVIFHAVDEYTTSLPLDQILQNDLILAYSSNGLDLPPELGYPFMVVAEDKLGYKWARWVTKIELSDDPEYLGYWESRGYSNEADVED